MADEDRTFEDEVERGRRRNRLPVISRVRQDVMWMRVRQGNTWNWTMISVALAGVAFGHYIGGNIGEILGLDWLSNVGSLLGLVMVSMMIIQDKRQRRREEAFEREMENLLDVCDDMMEANNDRDGT